jgi:hypothetical protein
MPLTDFLIPGENISFSTYRPVEYQGVKYDLYVSNFRLMWHKRSGIIFRKEQLISENLSDIIEMQYYEKGLFVKTGAIKIVTSKKKIEFFGKREMMKAIYSELQIKLPG